jgi:hypothetical protein
LVPLGRKTYLGFTFQLDEVSDKQINKGLDLEGGINVLQISVKDILKGYLVILKPCI